VFDNFCQYNGHFLRENEMTKRSDSQLVRFAKEISVDALLILTANASILALEYLGGTKVASPWFFVGGFFAGQMAIAIHKRIK
jgi:hypothetical protein